MSVTFSFARFWIGAMSIALTTVKVPGTLPFWDEGVRQWSKSGSGMGVWLWSTHCHSILHPA
jgi:hypothetical protein